MGISYGPLIPGYSNFVQIFDANNTKSLVDNL